MSSILGLKGGAAEGDDEPSKTQTAAGSEESTGGNVLVDIQTAPVYTLIYQVAIVWSLCSLDICIQYSVCIRALQSWRVSCWRVY